MAKQFQTYDNLLAFLETDKNLIIDDPDAARHILMKTSYFSLISGYKGTFKKKTDESK